MRHDAGRVLQVVPLAAHDLAVAREPYYTCMFWPISIHSQIFQSPDDESWKEKGESLKHGRR
jgi:hypothetical protein